MALAPLLSGAAACGYSQQEWEQNTREIEALRAEARAEREAAEVAEERYESALRATDALERALRERGIETDHLGASLAESERATTEYRARRAQQEALRREFAALEAAVTPLAAEGVTARIVRNRPLIALPAALLFEGASERLRPAGQRAVQKLGEALGASPALRRRAIEVAVRVGAAGKRGTTQEAWTLASARARAVLFALEHAGIGAERLSAAEYAPAPASAESAPGPAIPPSETVDLVLLPLPEETLPLDGPPSTP